MAKMVTRTFKTTIVNYLAIHTDTKNVEDIDFTLAGSFKNKDGNFDTKAITKALTKAVETEDSNVKVVKINTITENEVLYGMDEQDFLKNAKILPPRGANAGTDSDNTDN